MASTTLSKPLDKDILEMPKKMGRYTIQSEQYIDIDYEGWRSYMIYSTYANSTGMTFVLLSNDGVVSRNDIFGNEDLTISVVDHKMRLATVKRRNVTIEMLGWS